MASPVPVRSTSTIEVRLRVLRLARARCPLSSSVAGCSASRAGRTMPGRCDRRWGCVSNASFSSQGCPARTKCQPSPRPACNHHRKEGERPGRSLPRSCAHRFSGSDWHFVLVRCCPNGGLTGVARFSCRTSSVRAGILRPRRRLRARASKAAKLPDSEGLRRFRP